MKKRAMSLLLALVMMLALLPAQTWATDTVDEPGEAEEQTMPAEPQEEALKAEKTAEAPQVQAGGGHQRHLRRGGRRKQFEMESFRRCADHQRHRRYERLGLLWQ